VSDGSKVPFRIIDFSDMVSVKDPDPVKTYNQILRIFIVFCIIIIIDLKIRGLRKI
jgi:hypothetical protein